MIARMITYIDGMVPGTKTGKELWKCFGKGLVQCLYLMFLSYFIQALTISNVLGISFFITHANGSGLEEYLQVVPAVCSQLLWWALAGVTLLILMCLIRAMKPIKIRYFYSVICVVSPLVRLSTLRATELSGFVSDMKSYFLDVSLFYIVAVQVILLLLIVREGKATS